MREVIARNMRLLRAERGLSQEELAGRAEIHRTNISKVERELHTLSVDNLYWIAKALGVAPEDLLKGP